MITRIGGGFLVVLLVVTGCGGGADDAASPSGDPSTSPAGHVSEVAAKVDVGGQPCGVVGAEGAVWVSDAEQARVVRIDPAAGKVTATVDVDETPCEMTFAEGSIWVVTQSGMLDRVDPKTARVVARIPVGATSYEAVSAFGSIWVTNRNDRTITQVDPAANKVTKTVDVPDVQPGGIVAVGWELWVGNDSSGETHVIRLDPDSGTARRVEAGGGRPAFVTATDDSVWTANQNDGSVSRIDVASRKVTSTVKTGISPVNLDVLPAAAEVWVPDDRANTVVRIDAITGKVVETLPVGAGPAVVAAVDGDVWVTNFAEGTVWRISGG
jgi:YVTN family beta-propeller protein